MKKKKLIIFVLVTCLYFPISTFAETIGLKSGKTVEGKIIEKNDEYIKIDFQGVSLTYYNDEIESIDGQSLSASGSLSTATSKPQGALGAIVVVSDSRDFIKEWVGASYSYAPHIKTIHEIERNQTFYGAVVVNGYGVDNQGKIDLTGDLMILEPDGKVLFEDKDKLKIKMEKGGLPGGFLMFEATFGFVLEDSDPLGTYTVKAIVTDNILNKVATGEYKITLREKTKASVSVPVLNSDENFGKWMTYYYIQPEPEKIPSAIKYYSDSAVFNKGSSSLSVVAFFAAVFKNNGELMKKAYEDVSINGSYNSKITLLKAFWLVNNAESKDLINKANLDWKSEEISKQIQSILNSPPPDIFNDTIKDASQLDMLWATFLATGDSVPIKKIISALHLLKDGHGLDIAIGGAAQWSLGSNAVQHRRVYEICQEEVKNTDGETKKMLQEIIAKSGTSKRQSEKPQN
jgi:hypothetical protein